MIKLIFQSKTKNLNSEIAIFPRSEERNALKKKPDKLRSSRKRSVCAESSKIWILKVATKTTFDKSSQPILMTC